MEKFYTTPTQNLIILILSDLYRPRPPGFSYLQKNSYYLQGQTEWERFRNEILLPSKQRNDEFLNRIRQNGYGFTFDISSKLEYPTLIITGRQDHVVGYHDAWRLIEDYPRETFAVIDMSGHNLQIEQTDVCNALVHNWLNKVESEIF